MRGAILYAPGDIRVEERDDPRIEQPTDAIIRPSGLFSLPSAYPRPCQDLS